MRNKQDLKIRAFIQDSFGDELVSNAVVQDYLPELESFIININGFRYISGR